MKPYTCSAPRFQNVIGPFHRDITIPSYAWSKRDACRLSVCSALMRSCIVRRSSESSRLIARALSQISADDNTETHTTRIAESMPAGSGTHRSHCNSVPITTTSAMSGTQSRRTIRPPGRLDTKTAMMP